MSGFLSFIENWGQGWDWERRNRLTVAQCTIGLELNTLCLEEPNRLLTVKEGVHLG